MTVVSLLSPCVALAFATEASADAVTRTVNAPEDRVWAVTEAVLDQAVEKTLLDDIGKSL